jgi:hypothetical protein
MAEVPAEVRRPDARISGRRRAAGIYGTIVTAAVLAAAGGRLPTLPLTIAILVTLLVYWVAEEYAELLGDHFEGERTPTWPEARAALAASWPMVSASFAPLVVLVVVRLSGASPANAANVALAVAIILLMIHGWSAGRAAHLRGRQLLVVTSVAAALGLLMIALKDVVLIHLH